MDPFSAEGGRRIHPASISIHSNDDFQSQNLDLVASADHTSTELVNIHSEFHQGQYHKVTEFLISSLSPSNQLPARVLQLRARIALRQYDGVISELNGEDDTPAFAALRAFAQYSKDPWDAEDAMKTVERLVTEEEDNMTVQLLCGTILANQGRSEEAVALLAKHQGSLDA